MSNTLTLADLQELKRSLTQYNILPMHDVVYACIHPLELYWFWGAWNAQENSQDLV